MKFPEYRKLTAQFIQEIFYEEAPLAKTNQTNAQQEQSKPIEKQPKTVDKNANVKIVNQAEQQKNNQKEKKDQADKIKQQKAEEKRLKEEKENKDATLDEKEYIEVFKRVNLLIKTLKITTDKTINMQADPKRFSPDVWALHRLFFPSINTKLENGEINVSQNPIKESVTAKNFIGLYYGFKLNDTDSRSLFDLLIRIYYKKPDAAGNMQSAFKNKEELLSKANVFEGRLQPKFRNYLSKINVINFFKKLYIPLMQLTK